MCENCPPLAPEIKAAQEEFEAAIKKFIEATGTTYDIMTEWVLVTAQTELHANNDSYAVAWGSPWGQAVWKTKGLLQECLDNIQADNVAMTLMRD
jgi:hypothetical protein